MTNTLEMKDIRYLNLFERVMKIRTRFCFTYNNTIFFCVPKNLVLISVGENGRNIKKMSEILEREVRVVPIPKGTHDAKNFIIKIISPVRFRNLEIKNNEMVLSAGKNKAILFGRNKKRFFELQRIIKDFFGKELRIV